MDEHAIGGLSGCQSTVFVCLLFGLDMMVMSYSQSFPRKLLPQKWRINRKPMDNQMDNEKATEILYV